jgi:hypothetical protein
MAGARAKARRQAVAPPLRVRHRATLKTELRRLLGVQCFYCRIPLYFGRDRWAPGELPNSRSATIEHIVPRSMGGSNDIENLALACYRCNTIKSSNRYWSVMHRLTYEAHYRDPAVLHAELQAAVAAQQRVTDAHGPATEPELPPAPLCGLHGAGCRLATYRATRARQ